MSSSRLIPVSAAYQPSLLDSDCGGGGGGEGRRRDADTHEHSSIGNQAGAEPAQPLTPRPHPHPPAAGRRRNAWPAAPRRRRPATGRRRPPPGRHTHQSGAPPQRAAPRATPAPTTWTRRPPAGRCWQSRRRASRWPGSKTAGCQSGAPPGGWGGAQNAGRGSWAAGQARQTLVWVTAAASSTPAGPAIPGPPPDRTRAMVRSSPSAMAPTHRVSASSSARRKASRRVAYSSTRSVWMRLDTCWRCRGEAGVAGSCGGRHSGGALLGSSPPAHAALQAGPAPAQRPRG